MGHLTCKTTQKATKCNQQQNWDPIATIGLLKLISTQKVYKTYDKQGSILHYLGTNHIVIIKSMNLVMTFFRFHHVLIDATLGHIPYLSGSFRGGRFVQTVLIEDMSHCYDIFGLHHVSIGCHTKA